MSLAALRSSFRNRTPFPTAALRTQSASANGRGILRNSAQFRRRFFSTEPPVEPKKSNTALFAGLGLAAVGGIAFYVYTSQSDTAREAGTALKSGAQAAKVAANFVPTKDDYQKVISPALLYYYSLVLVM